MSNFRITTNGVMRNYRSNLYKSYKKLNDAMIRVQTHRKFNSYAEDPAAASRAFQLRRSLWRTDDRLINTQHLVGIYETAWSALDSIMKEDGDSNNSFTGIKESLAGITGTAGAGRQPLGVTLESKAEAIVKLMNSQYGDNFVFAGADGLNVPFTWGKDGKLLYRGIGVDTPTVKTEADFPTAADFQAYKAGFKDQYGVEYDDAKKDFEALQKMDTANADSERVYVDIGLGLEEDEDGNIISTSAYDSALSGITVLGYGTDEDGVSKNLASIMKELGGIFSRCDANSGAYETPEDEARAELLVGKLNSALDRVSEQYDKIDADAASLRSNQKQLTITRSNLEEQRAAIEAIDPADAITEMVWGQYCYNAALRIGNNILSQSLLDYMK